MFVLFCLLYFAAHASEQTTLPDTSIQFVLVRAMPSEGKAVSDAIMQAMQRTAEEWRNHAEYMAQQAVQQEFMHYLEQQEAYIQQQRRELEQQQLRQKQITFASKNYAQQAEQLYEAYTQWQETAPHRAQAYLQTMQNSQLYLREYILSDVTKQICKQVGIQIGYYDRLEGNTLQHALMQEIIHALNATSVHAPCSRHLSFQRSMYVDTLHMFDTARAQ